MIGAIIDTLLRLFLALLWLAAFFVLLPLACLASLLEMLTKARRGMGS